MIMVFNDVIINSNDNHTKYTKAINCIKRICMSNDSIRRNLTCSTVKRTIKFNDNVSLPAHAAKNYNIHRHGQNYLP